jgi:hypothetical protein
MGTDVMKKKILVVEDDDVLRLLSNEESKKAGYARRIELVIQQHFHKMGSKG